MNDPIHLELYDLLIIIFILEARVSLCLLFTKHEWMYITSQQIEAGPCGYPPGGSVQVPSRQVLGITRDAGSFRLVVSSRRLLPSSNVLDGMHGCFGAVALHTL
ncbi:hypothetical protein BDQ94DRAFT_151083 [Aspergillus welwitschiae]|uniref:Uncharacterized protein n=1 Tax=Aspergillus welwitschiae TaxID=1341132 RepID=A0A3F3PQC2_9EURO|nr:hypothetical protein BDQ94DRAFT_151083 [Aspergillus welwitschiae]RDH29150.1 hypothetical protein BDQ94DRAFT_151083 [Aspergillus welwitschiae]